MKLISMHPHTKIATVGCACGGQTIIPTFGATEEKPVRGRCPRCGSLMLYPNDLETETMTTCPQCGAPIQPAERRAQQSCWSDSERAVAPDPRALVFRRASCTACEWEGPKT